MGTGNTEMSEIEKRLAAAKDIARGAGEILKLNFRKKCSFTKKSDGTLVSSADIEAEKKIVMEIKRRFPEDSILSEEGAGDVHPGDCFLWVIDPLDGTHNYIKEIDIYGTSIAVCDGRKVKAGVIYFPSCDELYYAAEGGGAFKNGESIVVSKRPMNEATMFFDSSLSRTPARSIATLEKIKSSVFNIRMLGSTVAGLCAVACGRAEFEIEFCDKMWDFAAGLRIIEEAGGRASKLNGGLWDIDTVGYVASNGVFHDKILSFISL